MNKDYTQSKGYATGYKIGAWLYWNKSILYYTFCTIGTVISMISGNVCATMVGCTMLICHNIREL